MIMSDPISTARAMDEVWNDHDLDAAVDFFTEDAVVRMVPAPPGGKESITGRRQIREWAQDFFNQDFHVESTNYQAMDNIVTWDSAVHLDRFAEMGVDPVHFSIESVWEDGKVKQFTARTAEVTLKKLQEIEAAAYGGG